MKGSGGSLTPFPSQEKVPSKSPALLGLEDFHFTETNLNFVIFVNRKCLKAISSTKTKISETLFLNIYTSPVLLNPPTHRPNNHILKT